MTTAPMFDRPRRQRPQRPLGASDPRRRVAKRQGLTPAQVDAAYAAQGGRCYLCGKPLGAAYAVDHDHVLAERHGHGADRGCPACFRGLICHRDNGWLGWGGEDPEFFRRAAAYVERRRARA